MLPIVRVLVLFSLILLFCAELHLRRCDQFSVLLAVVVVCILLLLSGIVVLPESSCIVIGAISVVFCSSGELLDVLSILGAVGVCGEVPLSMAAVCTS